MARLQGAEKVVAKACLARQEARGQLSLSRARQAANETCLAVSCMLPAALTCLWSRILAEALAAPLQSRAACVVL